MMRFDITPQRRRELERYEAEHTFITDLDWDEYSNAFIIGPEPSMTKKQRGKSEREHNALNAEMAALAPRTDSEWKILREIEIERLKARCNDEALAVRRGKKNIDATSKGGKAKAAVDAPKIERALTALAEYCEHNPKVSRTAARIRIGKQSGVSAKTLQRHECKPTLKK
jgi:hypothetical protein